MGKATISADIGVVDIDIDLSKIDVIDLIEELESRGYIVEQDPSLLVTPSFFEKEESEVLLELIDRSNPKQGSYLYFIREKIANAR